MSIDDIVVSSRVRLARNRASTPFPQLGIPDKRLYEIIALAERACRGFIDFRTYFMGKLTAVEKQALVERHYISPALAKNDAGGALILDDEERISVMLNEEDHVRAQCIIEGLRLREAAELMDGFDSRLEREMPLAYDEKLGYLTSCPTNVGTGMRASVMVFAPALTASGGMADLIARLRENDYAIRGIYGEGSQSTGSMYQISNRRSLGLTEAEIVAGVERCAYAVCESERHERRKLMTYKGVVLRERVTASANTILNARRLTALELTELLSDYKLGVVLQLLPFIPLKSLDKLAELSQPANLCMQAGCELSADERDCLRAETAQNYLEKLLRI